MLGFDCYLEPLQHDLLSPDNDKTIAVWTCGLGGLSWIQALCEVDEALFLGGNGYPLSYTLDVDAFRRSLERGIPMHGRSMVLGDDYIIPANHPGTMRVDWELLARLPPQTMLLLTAWDLS